MTELLKAAEEFERSRGKTPANWKNECLTGAVNDCHDKTTIWSDSMYLGQFNSEWICREEREACAAVAIHARNTTLPQLAKAADARIKELEGEVARKDAEIERLKGIVSELQSEIEREDIP